MTFTDVTEIVGLLLIVVGLGLGFGVPVALVAAGVLLIAWSIALAFSGRDRPLRSGGER